VRRIRSNNVPNITLNGRSQEPPVLGSGEQIGQRGFTQFLVGVRQFFVEPVLLQGEQSSHQHHAAQGQHHAEALHSAGGVAHVFRPSRQNRQRKDGPCRQAGS